MYRTKKVRCISSINLWLQNDVIKQIIKSTWRVVFSTERPTCVNSINGWLKRIQEEHKPNNINLLLFHWAFAELLQFQMENFGNV